MDNLLNIQIGNAIQASQASGNTPRVPTGGGADAARAAANEFESFFLSQMLEAMFKGVGEDSPFSGGAGEKAFRGLLHEEYANVMAQSGGLGLADRLTTEILRYQEASQNTGGDTA